MVELTDNPMVYVVSGIFYVIMMGLIWGLKGWGSIDLKTKIIITIIAYPVCYLITEGMSNQ